MHFRARSLILISLIPIMESTFCIILKYIRIFFFALLWHYVSKNNWSQILLTISWKFIFHYWLCAHLEIKCRNAGRQMQTVLRCNAVFRVLQLATPWICSLCCYSIWTWLPSSRKNCLCQCVSVHEYYCSLFFLIFFCT